MVLKKRVYILLVDKKALVAELVDVVDLGSTALRCVGSSPTGGKTTKSQIFFIYTNKPVTPHVHNTPDIDNISLISLTSLRDVWEIKNSRRESLTLYTCLTSNTSSG